MPAPRDTIGKPFQMTAADTPNFTGGIIVEGPAGKSRTQTFTYTPAKLTPGGSDGTATVTDGKVVSHTHPS